MDLFNKLPEGTGKDMNKKQLQSFIKELLFEKSLADITDMVNTDYSELPGATLAIIQTISEASKSGDFSKVRPLLDYAFEKDFKARK